jgi:hypothetical protein
MMAVRKNVEFRKTERNPDLSGNHNGGDKLKMVTSVRLTLRQAQGEREKCRNVNKHFIK